MTNKVRVGFLILIGIVAVAAWFMFSSSKTPSTKPRTVTAQTQNIVQDITFTGSLQSKKSVDVSFELSGRVIEQNWQVGEFIEEGSELMKLDPTTMELELAQAQAIAASAKEDARVSLMQAQNARTKTAEENEKILERKRQAVRDAKSELDQQKVVHLQEQREDGDVGTTEAAVLGIKVKETALEAAQKSLAETETTAAKINQAQDDAVHVASAKYAATQRASARVSGLSQVDAAAEIAQMRLDRSVVYAPISGVITSVNVERGEYATLGVPVVTIQTVNQLELVADVPETDAAKLKESMTATVTFDALESTNKWDAIVTRIAPAAVVVEGVPTYEVILDFNRHEDILKPGLTANITVHANKKEGVIGIPRRAIINRNENTFVQVWNNNQREERKVLIGLIGSEGTAEVENGIQEGEEIVIDTAEQEE